MIGWEGKSPVSCWDRSAKRGGVRFRGGGRPIRRDSTFAILEGPLSHIDGDPALGRRDGGTNVPENPRRWQKKKPGKRAYSTHKIDLGGVWGIHLLAVGGKEYGGEGRESNPRRGRDPRTRLFI